jgi:hypothetical protein
MTPTEDPTTDRQYVRRLFDEPAEENVRIWRYMDFTKFVDILVHSGLFFSRCDLFEDQFEGSVTRATHETRVKDLLELGDDKSAEMSEKLSVELSDLRKWLRGLPFVNCWHMNEYESVAMWKLYSQAKEAIAIVSTYKRLRACLDETFWVEQVQYIDYDRDIIPSGNLMYPFVFKRRSFAHERELRAFTANIPATADNRLDLSATPSAAGIWVAVRLNELIETVHVAPMSAPWFVDLVREISKKYELLAPVKQSSLDRDPIY